MYPLGSSTQHSDVTPLVYEITPRKGGSAGALQKTGSSPGKVPPNPLKDLLTLIIFGIVFFVDERY